MDQPSDDIFPPGEGSGGATTALPPSESTGGARSSLAPAVLLDRLGRATTSRQRLRDAAAAIARAGDEEELVRDLVRHAQRVVSCDGATLFLGHADGSLTLVVPSDRGLSLPPVPAAAVELAGVVSQSGRPERDVRSSTDQDGRVLTHALLAAPMRLGTQLLGVLLTWQVGADLPEVDDEDRLATLASAGTSALAFLRREAQGEREQREIEALVDVARAAAASLRFGETLRLILRHASALTHADGALIALKEGGYLNVRAVHGSVALLAGVHVPVDGSLMGEAIRSGAPVICNDASSVARTHPTVRDLQLVERAVVVPLTTDRGAIGALVVVNRALPFTPADARVLHRLAELVAVAIINARLFEAVEQSTREWRAAVDAIDSGFFVLDDEHRVVRCNMRAMELARVTVPREAIGQRFEQLLLGCTDLGWQEPTILAALRERATARGRAQSMSDGRWFTLTVAPHPSGGVVVTTDIEGA